MITPGLALYAIPAGLRDPLLEEYRGILQNFLEQRWLPSELYGGRFSEIVYTILDGQAKKAYAPSPAKPANFPDACRKLENNKFSHVPHSFQILIPRMLPALYDVRNNRNVGHVGGDVDPNYMDSMAVVSLADWIMAELVRVFHGLTTTEAQQVVNMLVELRIPVIWDDGTGIKRVLRPELKLQEQLLLLIAAAVPDVSSNELIEWTEYDDPKYFVRTLRSMHSKRLIEFNEKTDRAKVLPPGAKAVENLIRKKNLIGI